MKSGFSFLLGINWALVFSCMRANEIGLLLLFLISNAHSFSRYPLVKSNKEQANRSLKRKNGEVNGKKCTAKWFVSFCVQNFGCIHKELINIEIHKKKKRTNFGGRHEIW